MVIVVACKAPTRSSISLPFLTVSWFRYQYDSYVHQGKLTPSSRERLFWIKMIPSPWLQWWCWNSTLICTCIPLATGTASGATRKRAWMKREVQSLLRKSFPRSYKRLTGRNTLSFSGHWGRQMWRQRFTMGKVGVRTNPTNRGITNSLGRQD